MRHRSPRPAPLQACSGDAAFLRVLREQPFCGVVHSVFERVVNLQRAGGDLFTIAVCDLDDAPNTLRVEASDFSGYGVMPGDVVRSLDGAVAVGDRTAIRIEDAQAWEPRLPRYPMRDERLRDQVARVRARLRSPCVTGNVPDAGSTDTVRRMTALLQRHATQLCDALARGDINCAGAAARGLVGLGPGLTPSGDDFLVGLFAVLRLPGGPCADGDDICLAVLCDLHERTNAISAAALRAAAQGQVRASLQALLHEMVAGDGVGLDRALARVLAIGSTSGADMAAGVAGGLEAQLRLAGRVPCH